MDNHFGNLNLLLPWRPVFVLMFNAIAASGVAIKRVNRRSGRCWLHLILSITSTGQA